MDLIELVDPATTVVLTQECQRGVIGDLSALPAMAEAVRTTGVVGNIGRIVEVGRDAGCRIVHCLAATRADRLGSSTNAPLFAAAARGPVTLLEEARRSRLSTASPCTRATSCRRGSPGCLR